MYRHNWDHQGIIRIADNATIPPNPRNNDWVEFQEWLAEGNIPEPAHQLPVPQESEILARLRVLEQQVRDNRRVIE